jgi:hypothetical protein
MLILFKNLAFTSNKTDLRYNAQLVCYGCTNNRCLFSDTYKPRQTYIAYACTYTLWAKCRISEC